MKVTDMSVKRHVPERGLVGQRLGSAGFTLLEVLIVVALIGTLSAGFAWSMSVADDAARLRNAGDDLAIMLVTVATQASLTAAPYRIAIEPGRGQFTVEQLFLNGDGRPIEHALPGGVTIAAVILDGELMREPVELVIQPSGYVRTFGVKLAYGQSSRTVHWDPGQQIVRTDREQR